MIEWLIYIGAILIDILLLEFAISLGKAIYDDFFEKQEPYVKISEETWEKLKEQTRKYNE